MFLVYKALNMGKLMVEYIDIKFLVNLPCESYFTYILKVLLHKMELFEKNYFIFRNVKSQRKLKIPFQISCSVAEY